MGKRLLLYGILAVAAVSRLLLQCAALPPYAGLDELYHVSRLVFVLQENRNPKIAENSMPEFLAASMSGDPSRMPDFASAGSRWPEVVRSRPVLIDYVPSANESRHYVRTIIESQQPRPYYSIVGRAGRLMAHRTQLSELRFWRLISVVFAVVIVLATCRRESV